MDEITLRVDGKKYGGWTAVSITRQLDAMAGTFNLTLTWKWPDAKSKPITEGSRCTVDIGPDRVITGYIDDWVPSYDAKTVSIAVAGRDKTADLVDCSVVHSSGQFVNQTLTGIANTVCKPFGIKVVVATNVGAAFPRIAIEQGETVHELLSRLALQRGVLLTSNAMGDLVITRASKEKCGTSLILGENILAARGRFSWRDRFDRYIVKGTGYGGGTTWDDMPLSTVGGQKATITDKEINRYRPRIIVNEDVMTAAGASKRGQWERQRAIGVSNLSEITVSGWRIPETGKLWEPNKLVPVKDEIQGLDGEFLIKTVMYSEDDQGRLAVIGVVPPDALDIPAIAKSMTKQGGTW